MKIKVELLKNFICDMITGSILDFVIDADEIVNTAAINALNEIKEVIKNDDLDDFEVVEAIVRIFEKYNISAGGRHDF